MRRFHASKIGLPIPLTGASPPPGWFLDETREDGARWINKKRHMTVIASISTEQDGKRWLHASISHFGGMAEYADLVYLKKHWIGDDRKAIMVLPEIDKHININPNVLHLFCCIDGDSLPDFTKGGKSL